MKKIILLVLLICSQTGFSQVYKKSEPFTHTYSIVGGDNASFSIADDRLLTAEVFVFSTKSSYSIDIQSSDGELSFQKTFIIG